MSVNGGGHDDCGSPVSTLPGGGLPAAWALLERVAEGSVPFDGERRAWALTEGVELSGWTLTEVQLAEGGDAALAQRLLELAHRREAEGAARRLAPWLAAPVPKSAAIAAPVDDAEAPLDRTLLLRVQAGQAALSPAQREMAIVDAMVRSDGTLTSTELMQLVDPVLAARLLELPEIDALTGAVVVAATDAIAA